MSQAPGQGPEGLPPASGPGPHRRDRHSAVPVFGILLVGLGVLLLLETIGVVGWGIWTELWRFWPVLLIALGVNMAFGRRYPWVAGVLVLVLIAASVWGAAAMSANGNGNLVSSTYQAPLGNAQSAQVSVDFGAGTLAVHSLPSGSDQLATAQLNTPRAQATVNLVRTGSQASLEFGFPSTGPFNFGTKANWDIGLSQTPAMGVDVKGGAADMTLDLHDLKVTQLNVNIGAASATVTMPANAGMTEATLESGASSIHIRIPDGVAARITSSSGLSSINVDTSRFPKVNDAWQSPGYDTAADRVDIVLKLGAASVDVR